VDVFSVRLRPHLAHDLVSRIGPTFSAGRRCRFYCPVQDAYYANHRAFFTLFALFTPVDIVDSLLKGVPHFLELGPQYLISSVIYFAGLVTAAITRNERYHQFYAIFFLVQTLVISFAIFIR
jgi:hypothetical protein